MDPRLVSLEDRLTAEKKTQISPLMQAKAKARKGDKVNACPFGCTVRHLDDNGYCKHLVGFTTPGDKRFEPEKGPHLMEPMHRDPRTGKRVVHCRMELDEENTLDPDEPVYRPILDPIPKDAVILVITASARVYSEQPNIPPVWPKKSAERRKREILEEVEKLELADV
jgi:hypothetical protein